MSHNPPIRSIPPHLKHPVSRIPHYLTDVRRHGQEYADEGRAVFAHEQEHGLEEVQSCGKRSCSDSPSDRDRDLAPGLSRRPPTPRIGAVNDGRDREVRDGRVGDCTRARAGNERCSSSPPELAHRPYRGRAVRHYDSVPLDPGGLQKERTAHARGRKESARRETRYERPDAYARAEEETVELREQRKQRRREKAAIRHPPPAPRSPSPDPQPHGTHGEKRGAPSEASGSDVPSHPPVDVERQPAVKKRKADSVGTDIMRKYGSVYVTSGRLTLKPGNARSSGFLSKMRTSAPVYSRPRGDLHDEHRESDEGSDWSHEWRRKSTRARHPDAEPTSDDVHPTQIPQTARIATLERDIAKSAREASHSAAGSSPWPSGSGSSVSIDRVPKRSKRMKSREGAVPQAPMGGRQDTVAPPMEQEPHRARSESRACHDSAGDQRVENEQSRRVTRQRHSRELLPQSQEIQSVAEAFGPVASAAIAPPVAAVKPVMAPRMANRVAQQSLPQVDRGPAGQSASRPTTGTATAGADTSFAPVDELTRHFTRTLALIERSDAALSAPSTPVPNTLAAPVIGTPSMLRSQLSRAREPGGFGEPVHPLARHANVTIKIEPPTPARAPLICLDSTYVAGTADSNAAPTPILAPVGATPLGFGETSAPPNSTSRSSNVSRWEVMSLPVALKPSLAHEVFSRHTPAVQSIAFGPDIPATPLITLSAPPSAPIPTPTFGARRYGGIQFKPTLPVIYSTPRRLPTPDLQPPFGRAPGPLVHFAPSSAHLNPYSRSPPGEGTIGAPNGFVDTSLSVPTAVASLDPSSKNPFIDSQNPFIRSSPHATHTQRNAEYERRALSDYSPTSSRSDRMQVDMNPFDTPRALGYDVGQPHDAYPLSTHATFVPKEFQVSTQVRDTYPPSTPIRGHGAYHGPFEPRFPPTSPWTPAPDPTPTRAWRDAQEEMRWRDPDMSRAGAGFDLDTRAFWAKRPAFR